ncbi:hypothetical protein [Nostoc sp.]|uniref:hypothetical protein n=1 Tax=Nostoc sp. TaxID=1180 RepID=UPI002FF61F39
MRSSILRQALGCGNVRRGATALTGVSASRGASPVGGSGDLSELASSGVRRYRHSAASNLPEALP